VHTERQEILRADDRRRPAKTLRRDADDGVVVAVDADGLFKDVAIEVGALPELVADDHRSRRRARLLFFRREVAAVDRCDAQGGEVVVADDIDQRLTCGVAFGDAGERDIVRGEICERAPRLAHVDEARIRERAVAAFGRAVLAEKADGFTGRIGAGERPDHQSVDDAEDPRVDADAERQHADRRQRESRMLEQKARAVAKVLPESPHHVG